MPVAVRNPADYLLWHDHGSRDPVLVALYAGSRKARCDELVPGDRVPSIPFNGEFGVVERVDLAEDPEMPNLVAVTFSGHQEPTHLPRTWKVWVHMVEEAS